jgi:hypothetical protein
MYLLPFGTSWGLEVVLTVCARAVPKSAKSIKQARAAGAASPDLTVPTERTKKPGEGVDIGCYSLIY